MLTRIRDQLNMPYERMPSWEGDIWELEIARMV